MGCNRNGSRSKRTILSVGIVDIHRRIHRRSHKYFKIIWKLYVAHRVFSVTQMVTETLNCKSNDPKQPPVQPQEAHSFTNFTGHELLQQTRNKARAPQNEKTCWHVATVPRNRRQCVPAGMPWRNITMSINMCGTKAIQSTLHLHESMSKMSTYSEAIRIPSSKVSLGIVASAHERHSSVWWSLSSLRRLGCINAASRKQAQHHATTC